MAKGVNDVPGIHPGRKMSSDPTSKVIESLEEFVERQEAELASQNEILLETARKEFEELLAEHIAHPPTLPRQDIKLFTVGKGRLGDASSRLRKSMSKAWYRTVFLAHRIMSRWSRPGRKRD